MSIDPPPTCAFSAGTPHSFPVEVTNDNPVHTQDFAQVPHGATNNVQHDPVGVPYQVQPSGYQHIPPHPQVYEHVQMPEPHVPEAFARRKSIDSDIQRYGTDDIESRAFDSNDGYGHSLAAERDLNPRVIPGGRTRDTVNSYLSAVASETEHDLRAEEAHRRAGRQVSLAAIMHTGGDPREEEEEVLITEDGSLEDGDLTEVQQDLDFVKATSTPNMGYTEFRPAITSPIPSEFEDAKSDSGFTEEKLESELATQRRVRQSMIQQNALLSPNIRGTSASVMSHSTYATDEDGHGEYDDAMENQENVAPLVGSRPLPQRTRSVVLPHLDRAREEHRPAITTMYQDMSITKLESPAGVGAATSSSSGADVGQVVQAIRRTLTMRQSPQDDGERVRPESDPNVGDHLNDRPFLELPRSTSVGALSDSSFTRRIQEAMMEDSSRGGSVEPLSVPSHLHDDDDDDGDAYDGAWLASEDGETTPVEICLDGKATTTQTHATPTTLPCVNMFEVDQGPTPTGLAPPLPPSRSNVEPPPPPHHQAVSHSISSGSSHSYSLSHDGDLNRTPPRFPTKFINRSPLTPTYEASREEFGVRIRRGSDSSTTTSTSTAARHRNSLVNSQQQQQRPRAGGLSGPREKPTPLKSPALSKRLSIASSIEVGLADQHVEPDNTSTFSKRKSHTSILGEARYKSESSPSGPSRLTRPAAATASSPIMKCSDRDARYHRDSSSSDEEPDTLDSLPLRSTNLSRNQERKASDASVRSDCTTATQLEAMILERKGSRYVFEHSQFMDDYRALERDGQSQVDAATMKSKTMTGLPEKFQIASSRLDLM